MAKCKKRNFTEAKAKALLVTSYYKRNILNNPNRKEIRCYYCEICQAWHVTSKPLVDVPN